MFFRLLLLSLLVFTVRVFPPCFAGSEVKDLSSLLETAHDLVGFDGLLIVAQGGEVIGQVAVGTSRGGETLTTSHLLNPGSIAKEFTTVALMMLEAEGRVSYSDPVSKYLDDLPSWSGEMTIEQLLSHESGLPDIEFHPDMTTTEALAQLQALVEPRFRPGHGYLYGNQNVLLRARIVEKITGMSFETFADEKLFKPAGMSSTIAQISSGVKDPRVVRGSYPIAVSGVSFFSNPADLLKWELALWSEKWVSRDQLVRYIVKPNKSGQRDRAYFDFGHFTKHEEGGLALRRHDGSNPDHHSYLVHDFRSDLIWVLQSSDGRKQTLFEISRLIGPMVSGESAKLPISWWFRHEMKTQGLSEALKKFPSVHGEGLYFNDEAALNTFGYELSGKGEVADAVRVMAVNLKLYPESANAHDSYADMLIRAGRAEEARAYIERGLILAEAEGNEVLIHSLKGYLGRIKGKQ